MVKYYTDMMKFYQCDNIDNKYVKDLIDSYKYKVKYEGYQVLYKFDSHWNTLAPKLVHSYACSSKCFYAFATPGFRYNIAWRVSYPVTSCYTYKYNYWW